MTKLYTKCEECKYKDNCDEKRMMACGYINSKPTNGEILTQSNVTDNAMPLMNTELDILRKSFEEDIFNQITNNAFCVFKQGRGMK